MTKCILTNYADKFDKKMCSFAAKCVSEQNAAEKQLKGTKIGKTVSVLTQGMQICAIGALCIPLISPVFAAADLNGLKNTLVNLFEAAFIIVGIVLGIIGAAGALLAYHGDDPNGISRGVKTAIIGVGLVSIGAFAKKVVNTDQTIANPFS